jgi:hypothetical protein
MRWSVGRACPTRTAAALAGFLCSCGASGALASEGGASFYIPGLTIPMAGFLPPPGVFFDGHHVTADRGVAARVH